jgi:hypothetical protein
MNKVKRSLEDKLKAMRRPTMPPEVEARIRQRLRSEAQRRPSVRPRRRARRVSYAQVALLIVLLAAAAWVVRRNVLPVLRAAWERAHCLVDSAPGKPPGKR